MQSIGAIQDLSLDEWWKRFNSKAFFPKYLKILNGQFTIERSWKADLKRAIVLVGRGLCSSDVPKSFLWNMIAIESLLTRQGDKYSDALPKRIEAFLGWSGYWSINGYEDRIRDLYRKRCELVHAGRLDLIEIEDLLFSDDLLLNLLVNLLTLTRVFRSKQDVIAFADRVEAERVLGIRPRVRPKQLRFFARTYTQEDYDGL